MTVAVVVTWLVIGLIAGTVVHFLDRRDVPGGWIATTIFGLIGALIGGYLTNHVLGFGITGINLSSILSAIGGGLLLALIYRAALGLSGQSKPFGQSYAEDIRNRRVRRADKAGESVTQEETKATTTEET